MVDTHTDSIRDKTRSLFGRLKTVVRRRSRDTRPTAPDSSTSKVTADPDANTARVNPENDISKTDDHDAKDFWRMAYDKLTERDRNTLATLLPAMTAEPQDAGCSRTKEILNQVVETTETQYREKERKDGIRAKAHRILNSALSFQDVISNTVKFDPTGYASSAWAIVSLALTMAKNHSSLQDAFFDSSEYLADLLTRCAFVEEQFYGGRDPVLANVEKEQSIVRVYVAILRYSAEVRRVQQFNKGKDIVESITAVTSQQLIQLKTSIKEEESLLHHWLVLDEHLRRTTEAETILARLDILMMDIKTLRDAVDMLNLPSAKGAFFGSFEDQHEDECLAGTRTELLQQVQDWGRSSDRHIFWLSGMAGTGKSTIARTVSRTFEEDGILGASFFFKRGERDRGSAAKFFSTIVKQLAVHIPQMIPGIRKALHDPTIPVKSLREQFDKLMLQPLLAVDHGESMGSTVIVIDALDECEPEKDVEIILDLLPEIEKATNMAIRFFLTSRPEIPIRFGFDQIDKSKYQNTILQNLDEDVIKHDIALYLREEFSKIQQRRRHALPPGWPGEERIEALAMMACPLFIFAATVCRFVADTHFDPDERLREFSTGSTGSKMDDTYRPVLNQLLVQDATDRNKLIEEFQRIIGVIILLANPLSMSSLAQLLLGTSEHNSSIDLERHISIHLDFFHSVLSIPSDANLPIRTLHLSFHDYLVDDRTKDQVATSQFWVDKIAKHELIASQCLTVIGRYLKKNICGMTSYGTSRTEIHPDSIARYLPAALQYACRYWVYHLTQSPVPARILGKVLTFLKEHFLHWFEAMGILGMISEAIIAVNSLLQLTKDKSSNEIHVFVLDARRFILKFAQIVDTAPLQLYSCGLIFAPHKALIRENFERELPAWLYRGPKVEEYWNPEMQTLEGHSNSVRSLWDAATGALKHSISTDHIATTIKFSEHLPLLITNIGSFDIQKWYKSFLISSEKVIEVSLTAGRWVTIQGQRELWLPPNYRPHSSTVKNSTIALGSTSGRVAIIAFSVMCGILW
ncbi:hypothetical protein BDV06DRAFT_217427 [Aspergillus oleicola]